MRAMALRVLEFVESWDCFRSICWELRAAARWRCWLPPSASERRLHIRSLIGCAGESLFCAWALAGAVRGNRVGSACCARFERLPSLYPYWHGRMFADPEIPSGKLEGYKAPLVKPGLFEHALNIVRTWTADLRELETFCRRWRSIPTMLMWGAEIRRFTLRRGATGATFS